MKKVILALMMAFGLSGCLGSGGGNDDGWGGWNMDPRLEAIALWAHDAGAKVVGMDPAPRYVPPVQGVNGTWGNGVFGTYYGGKSANQSMIRAQIDRPTEKHVQDIIAHEMGHFYRHLTKGNPSSEDYANWVNQEIRKLEAAGLIPPAPGIDWDAVSTVTVVVPSVSKPNEKERVSRSDDKD